MTLKQLGNNDLRISPIRTGAWAIRITGLPDDGWRCLNPQFQEPLLAGNLDLVNTPR
jgi:hypothetical protein